MPSSSTALTPTTLPSPPDLPFGYTELHKGVSENFDSDAGIWEMERVFQGAWDKRHDFVKEFMPFVDISGGLYLPVLGKKYPDYPLARAYKASIEGVAKSGLNPITFQIEYEKAVIKVGYKTSPGSDLNLPNPGGGTQNPSQFTFVTEEGHPELEVIKVPEKVVSYTIPSNVSITRSAVNDPYEIVLCHIHYTLTQHFVPQPNWAAIDDAMGKLNEVNFITPSGHTAEPRTLMYFGPSFSKKYTANEITAWEMQHDFVYKKIRGGWEQIFDKDTGSFVEIELKQWNIPQNNFITIKPYNTYDHNKIFSPPVVSP